jgi:hypothetical protein
VKTNESLMLSRWAQRSRSVVVGSVAVAAAVPRVAAGSQSGGGHDGHRPCGEIDECYGTGMAWLGRRPEPIPAASSVDPSSSIGRAPRVDGTGSFL